MRAGLLREVLLFEEPTKKVSPSGSTETVWTQVFECKAWKKNQRITGNGENALELFDEKRVIFQTRQYPQIKEEQRIKWNGSIYKIKMLDPIISDKSVVIHTDKEDE